MYVIKVISRTIVWTFPGLVATLSQPKFCVWNALPNLSLSSTTTFRRCYDQATLADFLYFRWLFYSLGGCVGSVGSLWYTFRYPCHQDWSDLSTWTRFLSLFKTFFIFVIVAFPKNRLNWKVPGSFFRQHFWKFCAKSFWGVSGQIQSTFNAIIGGSGFLEASWLHWKLCPLCNWVGSCPQQITLPSK